MDDTRPPAGLSLGPAPTRRPPDDPVVGWRYWQLDRASRLLRSVTHKRVTWTPGQPLRAVCLIGGHEAPAAGCACGIHASPDLAGLRSSGVCLAPGEPLVVGEAALWGVVVHDAHGLRAEQAAPARLWLVDATADGEGAALASLRAYGVPVATVPASEAVGEVAAAVLAFQAMSR
ncbi:MAG: hypothetical protein M3Q48_13030 [Actinomycetota bacterium]|nr:hypothetical protein [Actinomycetota bacterium]